MESTQVLRICFQNWGENTFERNTMQTGERPSNCFNTCKLDSRSMTHPKHGRVHPKPGRLRTQSRRLVDQSTCLAVRLFVTVPSDVLTIHVWNTWSRPVRTSEQVYICCFAFLWGHVPCSKVLGQSGPGSDIQWQ